MLNKPPFSFNKSLKDINFSFSVLRFFSLHSNKVFFYFYLALFCLPQYENMDRLALKWKVWMELMAKPRCEREWVIRAIKKVDKIYVQSFIYNLHKHLQAHDDRNRAMCATTKKSINRAWHGIKHPSKRSIKRPKMSDVCLSSGYCGKCNFDWAFESSTTAVVSNLSHSRRRCW